MKLAINGTSTKITNIRQRLNSTEIVALAPISTATTAIPESPPGEAANI